MMASMTFQWEDRGLTLGLAEFPTKLHNRLDQLIDAASARGEADMKLKAPWKDRTGAARAGLFTASIKEALPGGLRRYSIIFGHTVDYGIYLETIQNGKWQVIMPVLKATGDALMLSMNGLLKELDAGPELAAIAPEVGERGTSQDSQRRAEREGRRFKRTIKRSLGRVVGPRRPGVIRHVRWRR